MYKLAAITVALSGIMHTVAVYLGQFAADVLPLAIFFVLYLIFARWLWQRKRWAAWLTFLVMLVGITGALMSVNSGSLAPNWVFYSISALDILTAIVLFFVLWKSRVPSGLQAA